MCIYTCSIWWLVIDPLPAMQHPVCRWTDSEPGLDGSKPWPAPPCAAASMLNMVCWVYIIWVCLKIVYLIFQWIITMFPIKIAICGYPLFSDKPIYICFDWPWNAWVSVASLQSDAVFTAPHPPAPSEIPRKPRGVHPGARVPGSSQLHNGITSK